MYVIAQNVVFLPSAAKITVGENVGVEVASLMKCGDLMKVTRIEARIGGLLTLIVDLESENVSMQKIVHYSGNHCIVAVQEEKKKE